MDKIPKTFESYINKITEKVTYLDKYGGSVLATGLILISFFLIFSYFYVMNKLKPIKKDWVNQRCNPAVMPFAGLINAPPNSSKIEYTAENFTQCTQSILATIIGYFMAPINYTVQHMTEFLAEIMKSVNMIRHVFAYIRNKIMGIVANIFARIYNIIIPLLPDTLKLDKKYTCVRLRLYLKGGKGGKPHNDALRPGELFQNATKFLASQHSICEQHGFLNGCSGSVSDTSPRTHTTDTQINYFLIAVYGS